MEESAHPQEAEALRSAVADLERLDTLLTQRRKANGIAYFTPNAPQLQALNQTARTVIYSGGNRPLAYGTLVRMADATTKPIEDIQIGDWILAPDGDRCVPTQVTAIPFDGEEPCWRAETRLGTEVVATADHVFPASKGQNCSVRRYTLPEIAQFPSRQRRFQGAGVCEFLPDPTPLPFSGLLLGLYLGDGSSGTHTRHYQAPNFTNTRQTIMALFQREVATTYPRLRMRMVEAGTRAYVCGATTKGQHTFSNDLRALGIDRKARTKFIPERYQRAAVSVRCDLLRGLILTDGCVDQHRVSYYTASPNLAHGVQRLLLGLGIRSTLAIRDRGVPQHAPSHVVRFSALHLARLQIDLLHKSDRVAPCIRKHRVAESHLLIKRVDPVGKRRVRCLTIAHPSHLFLLANGMLTSNSGKSEVGAFWLASHLSHRYASCPCHGSWFKGKTYTRPLKAVIASTEYPIIERVIEPKLMKLLPQDWIKDVKRTPQGYLRRVLGKDGGTIDILSNEMDQLAFEGADWDLAWVDEPTQQAKWVAIQRGLLDREGLALLTFTPIVEPWMKEQLIDRADHKTISVVDADTYANTHTIHGEPILTKDAIQAYENALPEEERATRIHGQFFHLRGLVYKELLPGIHDREWDYKYPDPVVCVLDPHTRKPHWVIWAHLNRMDQLFVDRELLVEGTLRDLGKQILLTEQRAGYNVRLRLIDPNYGRTQMNILQGRTVIEELALPPFPLRFTEANDDEEAGIFKVKQLLHFNRTQEISLTNMPLLYFHRDRTPKTFRSLRNLQHEEWKGKTKGEKDPKETIKAKDDDGADCVRYLAMHNPTFDWLMRKQEAQPLAEVPY